MANRLQNLDPALGGSQAPQYPLEDRTSKDGYVDSYRADAGHASSYANSAQQPYYQYSPTGQPDVAPVSAGGSAQTSPGYLTTNDAIAQQSPEDGLDASGQQDDAKRQRACEACRGLKVRCNQDPDNPDAPCKRCAKAGRTCVITQPTRKRQKKADTRVAELEKKLDALTAALENRQSNATTVPSMSGMDYNLNQSLISPLPQHPSDPVRHVKQCDSIYEPTSNAKRKRMEDAITEQIDVPASLATAQPSFDTSNAVTPFYTMSPDDLKTKINALVPLTQSTELYKYYNDNMAPYLPMVIFPKGSSADQLFHEKPVLYLAVISAASGSHNPADLSFRLRRECLSTVADYVVKEGAKSLELIQAMLIMACWYQPPDRPDQHNFYQIIHMAAVMALDIGLGRRPYRGRTRTTIGKYDPDFSMKFNQQDSSTLEARRAWLGCYYLCATASMVLRRPNLVRWSEYIQECIEVLETSSEAQASDKLLCQHIKIQRICEDIGLQFLMDDSTAQLSINDPKVTYALVTLENQLKSWKRSVPEETQCATLTFSEHVTSLYLHEIALHFNHNIEDFRLPFTEESLQTVNNSSDTLTQNQIAAIEACMQAAHGILDTMIKFNLEEMLGLPLLLYFVRCLYALVILIKMHVAINTPGSELGKLMQSSTLKTEYYLDATINTFASMKDIISAKPDKALRILGLLREWFQKHKDGIALKQTSDAGAGQGDTTAQKYNQTPLDMLSQVATGQQSNESETHADWTFNTPGMFDHKKSHGDARNKATAYYPSTGGSTTDAGASIADSVAYTPNLPLGLDPSTSMQGYGWGTGFEQAMDMTLGYTGDLQGGGLDDWFLGENVAPFAFAENSAPAASGSVGQW